MRHGSAIIEPQIQGQLVTDASQSGWGATFQDKQAQGFWNSELKYKSSNHKEMWAVFMALISFRKEIANKTIQVLSDNISTVAYLNHMGGPNHELSQVAETIWTEAVQNNVKLVCRHIPGAQNVTSDGLSRLDDKFEWKLHPEVFKTIDNMWGPHTVDRFASLQTAHLPRFNSRFHHPLSEGIDALAQQNWHTENNSVNPPFRLMPQVMEIIRTSRAIATVIAPLWRAQPWFQQLK